MGLRFRLLLIVSLVAGCGLEDSATAPDGAPSVDSGAGDSAAGDSRVDDGAVADTGVRDSATTDSGASDSRVSDSASGDTSALDGGGADTAVVDTGAPGCSTAPAGTGEAVALPAPVAITIDGDLSDWTWRELVRVDVPEFRGRAGPAPGSSTDLSASLAVLWTVDTLYVAVVVTDDAHYNESAGELIWEGDSVQIAFDVAHDGGTPYDDVNDFEYGWAQNSVGTQRYRWMSPTGAPAASDTVTIVRRSGETTYEARLAASDLGLAAFGAGDRFGFSWMVNEMDAAGTSEGFAEWTSGIGYTKDPSLFGDLVLRDCD